ncbi:ParB/RepB/Spo0J family partition protein [Streptomycetaceae bacterium NBC_01309]
MATVEITHTRAEGTLLTGSSKGDGVFDIVRHHGFRPSRTLGCLYIRQSRDREAKKWLIDGAADALRAAGHEVTVTIDEDTRRTFADAEADRTVRAEDRACRFGERADKASGASEARFAAADRISQARPFGQPILVGHHSERRARRDQARVEANMHAGVEELRRAKYWTDRAGAAEAYEEHRKDPQRTRRRLKRLGAELRQQQRYHVKALEEGWSSVDRHAREIQDLTEQIAYWEQIVAKAEADGVKMWSAEDFAGGDFVYYLGSWREVARVNPQTLSVAWNLRLAPQRVVTLADATFHGSAGTHLADYTQVGGRCPGDAMRAFLADGKVPGLKSAREASEAAPAAELREARRAKSGRRSDPSIPKRVRVDCQWKGTEATLTWLNGRGQPHPGHPPVAIAAEPGTVYAESVWSESLRAQVSALLAKRGYAYRGSWTGSPASGIVCAIAPLPEAAPHAPAEQPTPKAAVRQVDGQGQADECEAPVDHETATPDAAEKLAPTCDFSENTRNLSDRSRVGHSDYPLNPSQAQERAMTATTPEDTTPAPDKAAPTKKSAAKRTPRGTKTATPTPKADKPPAKRAPRAKKSAAAAPADAAATEAPAAAEPPAERSSAHAEKTVQRMVPTDRIDRDPAQPREIFDEAGMAGLIKSMRKLGQLQPITVRYVPETKRYILVMGERRWRAAKSIGLARMSALVLHGVPDGSRETLAKAVAENVGRVDMTPIEEAKAFQRLVNKEYTVDEVAEIVGKSVAYVGWRIDLLKLCDSAREALAKGHLPVGLAWYVSLLNADNQMRFLVRHARGEFKSTRDAEAFAQAARDEERRMQEQGSFFVLAEDTPAADGKAKQDVLPGSLDMPVEERERIVVERAKVVRKIERLGDAGAILADLAAMKPEELALLLAGTPGGVGAHRMRVEHLRDVALAAAKTLRSAQAIASVRGSGIQINPEALAEGPTSAPATEATAEAQVA